LGHRRGRFIRIIKVLLVERSNTVGADLRVIRLHGFARRQGPESHRESLVAVGLRNTETTALVRFRKSRERSATGFFFLMCVGILVSGLSGRENLGNVSGADVRGTAIIGVSR
jgi:ribosomal protein L30/L7E